MRAMVRRFVVVGLVVLLSAGAASAAATGSCVGDNPERPYVCDIGDPLPLSMVSFLQLMQTDGAIRKTVARIGLPDAAEIQRVENEAPWLDYEVRTYYRAYGQMYVFARAFILGNPQVSLLRHQGPIPEATLARMMPIDAEAEALRAEQAAAEAEAMADRAERRADAAERAADMLAADFPRRLQKN
ncbi:MAG: hypothetical protein FJ144_25145 [Deltaproteobacteria bacterium]|nr:hypothetical protein [Deltaproteobacteria bacterium]